MIYTYSVLKGYEASLGLFAIRLAFLLSIWATGTTVPETEIKNTYHDLDVDDLERMRICQISVHILCTALSILSWFQYLFKWADTALVIFEILTVILMIATFLWQFRVAVILANEAQGGPFL